MPDFILLTLRFAKRAGRFFPKKRRLKTAGVIACAAVLSATGCRTVPPRPDPEATRPKATAPAEVVQPFPEVHHATTDPVENFRYREIAVDGPWIAITFDDGPSPRHTPRLLDILKERDIRATFFVLGQRVTANRQLLERMDAEGHEVANHSWDHARLDTLDAGAIREQLEWTNSAIHSVIGRVPTLMRPPFGATGPSLNQWITEQHGLKVIMWSVDSNDWNTRNSNRIRDAILADVRPGAIILAHDIHPATIAAMPETLDALLARGYRFVTVSELIELGR